MIQTLFRIVSHPWFLIPLLLLASGTWVARYDYFAPDNAFESQRMLDRMLASDPQAREVLARHHDERSQQALRIAANSARFDGRPMALLTDMATEAKATQRMPHRARLAAILADQGLLMAEETRAGFLQTHATSCQALAATTDPLIVDQYVHQLEQASATPGVWELVRDDPIALLLWSHDQPMEVVAFYHAQRDWLQDPLLDIDPSRMGSKGKIDAYIDIINAVRRWPTIGRQMAMEDELGGPGLALLAVHGDLIARCVEDYQMRAGEVAAIIFANPDAFQHAVVSPAEVNREAARLAVIAKDHPMVWRAALQTPLALRLHQDSPEYADRVLAGFGHDDITVLIYSFSDDPIVVDRLARSLDQWGDVAIVVMARYIDRGADVVKMITDPKIGLRAIPFIARFQNDAFARAETDVAWCDRYFDAEGKARVDQWAWLDDVPLGSIVNVARRAKDGHPNDWGELGWAALDIADLVLIVASVGTATPAVLAKSAAVNAVKQGVRLGAKKAGRTTASSVWRRGVIEGEKSASRLSRVGAALHASRTASAVEAVATATARMSGAAIGAAFRFSRALVMAPARMTVHGWKALTPMGRKWVLRGLAAAGLFVILIERTIPNLDRIAAGLGQLASDLVRGVVTAASSALGSAIDGAVKAVLGEGAIGRAVGHWLPPALMIAIMFHLLWRRRGQRTSAVRLT